MADSAEGGAEGHRERTSRRGGGGGGGRGQSWPTASSNSPQNQETELLTKTLQIQSKRFYLDVKENTRGRFLKIAEISSDGRRSQIYFALSSLSELRNRLTGFVEYLEELGTTGAGADSEEATATAATSDGKLKSELIIKTNRRYYLDLKENPRGRYLRISQIVSRSGQHGNQQQQRSQIALPASGLAELRDSLNEIIEEFCAESAGQGRDLASTDPLPEGKHLRVDNKMYYFDVGKNPRGVFLRVSEVKSNYRNAITIPAKSWTQFRDIFNDFSDKLGPTNEASVASVSGTAGGEGESEDEPDDRYQD